MNYLKAFSLAFIFLTSSLLAKEAALSSDVEKKVHSAVTHYFTNCAKESIHFTPLTGGH